MMFFFLSKIEYFCKFMNKTKCLVAYNKCHSALVISYPLKIFRNKEIQQSKIHTSNYNFQTNKQTIIKKEKSLKSNKSYTWTFSSILKKKRVKNWMTLPSSNIPKLSIYSHTFSPPKQQNPIPTNSLLLHIPPQHNTNNTKGFFFLFESQYHGTINKFWKRPWSSQSWHGVT